MERATGILAKIEEKASSKSAVYPTGRMWMNQEDCKINELTKSFSEKHMAYVMQSLVFEKMCEGSFRDATALMEWQIRLNLEAFRSDQLTTDSKSPNKMFYDSVRITGLKISSAINIGLIKLH